MQSLTETQKEWIVISVLLVIVWLFVLEALYWQLKRRRRDRIARERQDRDVAVVAGARQKGRIESGSMMFRGLRRYSPYFGEYVEVVRYVDDDHWSFRFVDGSEMGATYGGVFEARTRLSALPLKGPERVGFTPQRKR